jgi:hypothetical protein
VPIQTEWFNHAISYHLQFQRHLFRKGLNLLDLIKKIRTPEISAAIFL